MTTSWWIEPTTLSFLRKGALPPRFGVANLFDVLMLFVLRFRRRRRRLRRDADGRRHRRRRQRLHRSGKLGLVVADAARDDVGSGIRTVTAWNVKTKKVYSGGRVPGDQEMGSLQGMSSSPIRLWQMTNLEPNIGWNLGKQT